VPPLPTYTSLGSGSGAKLKDNPGRGVCRYMKAQTLTARVLHASCVQTALALTAPVIRLDR
jgi:hypothetical protein